eukprot:TRINITY_DN156_c0_g1_i1.p1 TRINITY_DN156_c0_g1~~TRINITY_DN156_c0_g1_i1.p1  ORF type:complete len:101 (+),score=8.65 TRINITY_DN156_c0_g1_i1:159-461(+)
MFAVVKTGGKQYRVAEGDVIKVEKLDGEVGKNVVLDEVLMVGDDKGVKVGEPLVKGAKVTFEVLEQKKKKKKKKKKKTMGGNPIPYTNLNRPTQEKNDNT